MDMFRFKNIALLFVILTPEFVVPKRRHRHTNEQKIGSLMDNTNRNGSTPQLTHKKYKCGIRLKNGCSCHKSRGSLAVSCNNADLQNVPSFEMGIEIVRTLNLENNRIEDIQLGAFYGMKIESLLLGNNSLSQLNVLAFWGLEFYLETLDVSFNNFYAMPYASLRLLRHLRSLSFSSNSITHLGEYGFESSDKLEVLSLDANPISEIDTHAFSGTNLYLLILNELDLPNGLKSIPTKDLKTLKGLSLAGNAIDVIPNQWLSNLTSLKYLKLDDNDLSDIQADVFKEIAISLRTLELNANKFRKVPRKALRLLIYLETLRLSNNQIKKLHARSFNCSRNLQILDLSNNDISDVSNAAFHGLDSIQKIDLRNNQLITIDDRLFYWTSFANKEIHLSHNPWLCNCLLKWLKREYRKGEDMIAMFPDLIQMRCKRPDYLRGRPIVRLPLSDFNCDHDYYYYVYEDDEKDEEDRGEYLQHIEHVDDNKEVK